MMQPGEKRYLTDGAYVTFLGEEGWALTAENGITATDRVVLDDYAMKLLIALVEDTIR